MDLITALEKELQVVVFMPLSDDEMDEICFLWVN
jgi:hypothetical protein